MAFAERMSIQMAGKIRVLVVDDSSSVRTMLIKGLSADPGIQVVGFACDGVEALEQVKALQPDVITLDVELPQPGTWVLTVLAGDVEVSLTVEAASSG